MSNFIVIAVLTDSLALGTGKIYKQIAKALEIHEHFADLFFISFDSNRNMLIECYFTITWIFRIM